LDKLIEEAFVALLDGAGPEKLNVSSSADISNDAQMATKLQSAEAQFTAQGKLTHQRKGREKTKGDPRVIVDCGTVEELVFGSRYDPNKVFGRKKNRATRVLGGIEKDWRSVDMESDDADQENRVVNLREDVVAQYKDSDDENNDSHDESVDGGVNVVSEENPCDRGNSKRSTITAIIRPPQTASEVNGSVGGEKGWAERIEETPDMLEKRREGQRRAEEREMVRRAARRGCAFGFIIKDWASNGTGAGKLVSVVGSCADTQGTTARRKAKSKRARGDSVGDAKEKTNDQRRKCEAIMNGSAVEASFAKGDFAIRYRAI